MTSEKKQRANRHNARASTGPRSPAGKARVAANALRHGLTIPDWFNRGDSAEIELLVRHNLSSFPRPSPQLVAFAQRLAQAMFDFIRVCEVARVMLQPVFDIWAVYSPRKRKNMARLGGWMIRKRSRRLLDISGSGPTVEKLELVLSDSAKQLNGIERQEHRALARLRRALRDFDAACVLEAISKRQGG